MAHARAPIVSASIAIVALVITLLPASVFAAPAEAGALPNSFLYTFDRFFEGVQLFFAFDPHAKAGLLLRNAEERIAECGALTGIGQSGYCDRLMADYEKDVRQAYDIMNTTTARYNEISSLLGNETGRHTLILRDLSTKVPEAARPAIEHAINASLQGQETISLLRRIIREEAERAIEERNVAERVRTILENTTGTNLTAAQKVQAEASVKEEVKGIMRDVEGILISEAERYIRERNTTDIREILSAIRGRTEVAIENATVPLP